MVTTAPPAPARHHPDARAHAAVPAGRTPGRHRDRFLDLVRVAAMVLVVGQHWLVTMLAVDDGAIALDRTVVLARAWPLTWATQVMPLVFLTAGAAAVLSLRGRAVPTRAWVARRVVRLVGGVVVLAAVWLPLAPALVAAGLDPTVVGTGARLVGALLWFLVVLVLLTVLTPALVRLADRYRGREVAVLAAAAVGVDVLRFGVGLDLVGYLNAVLVWAAVYVVGLHLARGRLAWLRGGRAAVAALAGAALLAVAVGIGPYPAAMIGLPGTTVSNMNPPSAALLLLATAQTGLVLVARPALSRLADSPRVARALDAAAPRTMAVYCGTHRRSSPWRPWRSCSASTPPPSAASGGG